MARQDNKPRYRNPVAPHARRCGAGAHGRSRKAQRQRERQVDQRALRRGDTELG